VFAACLLPIFHYVQFQLFVDFTISLCEVADYVESGLVTGGVVVVVPWWSVVTGGADCLLKSEL
jgi:hypothetical protein